MTRKLRVPGLLLGAIFLATACSSGTSPTPSPAASSAAATTPAATSAASPSVPPTATPAPTPVASVPDSQLVFKGKLEICSDIPYPPQEFFDDQGNPIGSDMAAMKTSCSSSTMRG